jgi:hypothetical protein
MEKVLFKKSMLSTMGIYGPSLLSLRRSKKNFISLNRRILGQNLLISCEQKADTMSSVFV